MDRQELTEYLNRLQAATDLALREIGFTLRCTFTAAGVDDTWYVMVPGIWPEAAANLTERLEVKAWRNVEVLT